MYIYSYLFCLY